MARNSLLIALCLGLLWATPLRAQVLQENARLPVGYYPWSLPRDDGSAIVFFTNFRELNRDKPLAVWMQGSGFFSLFPMSDGVVRNVTLCLVDAALQDVQVVAVEKRGVPFGTVGNGAAIGATQEYQEHATLDERSRDVIAVLTAFQEQRSLPDRLLAIGHSEGADVAAKVAADFEPISHVAFLSGGGPSQLLDFMTLIRKSPGTARDKEAEIAALWKQWEAIQADPLSTDKQFQGHAYRRWSSYISQPPVDNLLKTQAEILIIHGSEDTSIPIESADLCAVRLNLAHKTFEYLRLPEADHSLRTPTQVAVNTPPFVVLGQILRRFFLADKG